MTDFMSSLIREAKLEGKRSAISTPSRKERAVMVHEGEKRRFTLKFLRYIRILIKTQEPIL